MIFNPNNFPQLEYLKGELAKSHNREYYIYGAGITARKLCQFIRQEGYKVLGFVIDNPKITELMGLPVRSFGDLDTNPVYMILGYVPTRETVAEIRQKVPAFVNLLVGDFTFLSFDLFEKTFLEKHAADLDWLLGRLADDHSREVLMAYIKSRNSANPEFTEPYYNPYQYFPEHLIHIGKDEVFVDCGVYDGETIRDFKRQAHGNYRHVFGFEPDSNNYANTKARLANELNDVTLFNKGTWSNEAVLRFSSSSERVSEINPYGEDVIEVDSIDNLVKGCPVTYIKMDVEGAELETLKGAREIILRNKPKLAVCLYHKSIDLVDIPHYIDSMNSQYRFYLRLHTRYSQELVLYCL